MDFWIRLKSEIKAKNTTQEWVAGKIGVPFGTFRKWMTRKTYPNIIKGVEIAKLLETSAEYLVTGEKQRNQTIGIEPESVDNAERKLLSLFRKLSPTDKENAMLAMNAWARKM
jgi:transcriptional regulator with XRE-family HTH domain